MRRLLPFCGMAAILSGCGGSDAPGTAGQDGPDAWAVEEVVRIGSVDDPEQSLTDVRQVLFGPAGEVIIPQPRDHAVRVFDESGALLRTIGRAGEGPGEFGALGQAGLAEGALVVADNGLSRLTYFDLDGELLRTQSWPRGMTQMEWGAYMTMTPEVLLADGTGLFGAGMIVRAVRGGGAQMPSAAPERVPYVRTDSTGENTDTIAWRPLEPTASSPLTVDGREFPVFWPRFDAPIYRIAVDGSGIVVVERRRALDASPSTFRVLRIGVEGDTVFVRDVPYEPVPTPATLVSEVSIERAGRLTRDDVEITPEEIEGVLRSGGLVPAMLEPVNEVTTGADGTIWLELTSASRDTATWLVLGRDGQPIGSVGLPAGQRVLAATADRIATLELDELDVPYVVVYRYSR